MITLNKCKKRIKIEIKKKKERDVLREKECAKCNGLVSNKWSLKVQEYIITSAYDANLISRGKKTQKETILTSLFCLEIK